VRQSTALRTPLAGPITRKVGGSGPISVAGVALIADCAGALYWPDEGLLAVSDLHLEKGSSYAARGVLLPPYDTAETLVRVAELIFRYSPRVVVALGDNFHDRRGPGRVSPSDRGALAALQRRRDWIWITGNHDPEPTDGIGGIFADIFALGALVFRHIPTPEDADGEIAGHLHPLARVGGRGRVVSRRCFASDGRRLVMPAFGAYTGGLNVRHAAFTDVFGTAAFAAHVLGQERLYTVAANRCVAD
jgi:uncharacterized protein